MRTVRARMGCPPEKRNANGLPEVQVALLEQAKENYKRAYTLDPSGSAGNRAAENYNRLQNTTTESQNTVTPSDKTTPTL